MSASQNDDDEQKDPNYSTEDLFDEHQYIDSSLFISDEDDIMEKLKRRIKQYGEKFQEGTATRKENAIAKQKMAEAMAKKRAEQEAERAVEEARMKAEQEAERAVEEARMADSTDGEFQDPESGGRAWDEISDSVVMSDIRQSQPQHESQVQEQSNPVMTMILPQKSGNTVAFIVVAVVFGLVIMTVLAGILYVWANNLADEKIKGTWYNPAQTLTYSSGGDLTDSTNTFDEWRVDGNMLYMVDPSEPGYEYYFQYTISDDVLFLAPIDIDNTIKGEDCTAYSRKPAAIEADVFEEEVVNVAWPSWCTPEE